MVRLRTWRWEQHLVLLKDVFGDFVAQRRLDGQQATSFYRILRNDDMADAEDTDAMLDGDNSDSTTKGRSAQKRAKRAAQAEQALHLLLGPEGHAAYEEYLKSGGERVRSQNSGSNCGSRTFRSLIRNRIRYCKFYGRNARGLNPSRTIHAEPSRCERNTGSRLRATTQSSFSRLRLTLMPEFLHALPRS